MHSFALRKFDLPRCLALFAIAIAVSLLAGCSVLGLQKPQSDEDGLRYTQSVLTGTYQTIGDATKAGTLTAAQNRSLMDRLKQPDDDLKVAERVIVGKQTQFGSLGTAREKVQAALAILTTISGELRQRGLEVKPVTK